jgi:hypothetical protein
MEDGSRLTVRGSWAADGAIDKEPGARIVLETASVATQPVPELSDFSLTAYPNPSRGITTIEFKNPGHQRARLEILDSVGRIVTRLGETDGFPGMQRITWRADADLASGVYYVRLRAGATAHVRPLVLAR